MKHTDCRLRNEEHSRLQEMRLQHAEDVDKANRRRAATLASLTRQAELDREDWARRAKEGASAGREKVGVDVASPRVSPHLLWLFRPGIALGIILRQVGHKLGVRVGVLLRNP